METIDRRNMLIGSGLALAFGGLGQGARAQARRIPIEVSPAVLPSGFEDGWNHGDKPWIGHPNQGGAAFDPSHTAILYLEFVNSGLKAKRVHFPSVGGANDWPANKPKVVSFLNFLNGSGACPGEAHVFPGLKDFAFDRPHHFVVYIKNPGVDYLQDRPVWFGKKLIKNVYGIGHASKNESFFGAIRDSGSISGGSPNLVYMRNYYHIGNGNGQNHRPIKHNERLAYALKINALMPSADDPTYKVPLIIDPDTGNMGEGQPRPQGGSPPPGSSWLCGPTRPDVRAE